MRWQSLLCVVFVTLVQADCIIAADRTSRTLCSFWADDLGYTDLSCYREQYYETPNIDRMVAEGMRFYDGYTCGPTCQPTRAALMSGQYGPRTGVYTVGGIERFNWRSRPLRPVDNVTELPLEKITVAQSLKAAGYATAIFGKWHLGEQGDYHPRRRGFDEAIVTMASILVSGRNPPVDYLRELTSRTFSPTRRLTLSLATKSSPSFFI